jgi:hypothetical protein
MKRNKRWWVIQIDDEYFVKFKTQPMGRWTKSIALATPMITRRANSYVRELAIYGAIKVRGASPREDTEPYWACKPGRG